MKIVKKLFIIGFGFAFLAILSLWITYHFWPDIYSPKINSVFSTSVLGKSMEPTLMDGEAIKVDFSITPRIKDMVVFRCFTGKCLNGDPQYDNERVKRLTDIDSRGCYYFLGDNPDKSWDSRNYGYLCPPNDVKIQGVVIQ